jgi:hypothetical protein
MGFPIAAQIADVAFIVSSYTSLPLQAFSSGITHVSLYTHSVVHKQNLAEHINLNLSQCSQYKLKESLDTRKLSNILDSVVVRTKALLLGKSLHYATSWLFATPNTFSNSIINPKAFQFLLKYHSAMPICVHDQRCLSCGIKMYAMGDHLISCNVTGKRIGKHNSFSQRHFNFF